MLLSFARTRIFAFHLSSHFHLLLPQSGLLVSHFPSKTLSYSTSPNSNPNSSHHVSAANTSKLSLSDTAKFLFVPPGVDPDKVTDAMILPFSNIVAGPYVGDAKVKEVSFAGSSNRPKDCPKDERPEFAMLGRSNVGKSSLINALVRKKEVALTSKKPGKTQLINHFLINKSWYLVDLPGYGFANAPESARMDWSSFTKGYFLNRETLVSVLLLVDASVPPQKIDLDCANWLGRNNIPMTVVFTKCDKMKNTRGKRPDENIKAFQELIRQNYKIHPLWIMTSSSCDKMKNTKGRRPDENIKAFQELIRQNIKIRPPWIMMSNSKGLGRDELLLHMSQLRNYWDN